MGTSNILDELEWRGLIAQSTDRDALGKQLAAGPCHRLFGVRPDRAESARRSPHPAADAASVPAGGAPADRAGRRRDRNDRRSTGDRRTHHEHRVHRRRLDRPHPRSARAVRRLRRLPVGCRRREQPDVDRRAGGDRVPPRHRKALLGQRDARPRHGAASTRGGGHLLHRVQLHAVAGQRLRGTATGATAARCRSAAPISGATSSPAFGWCGRSRARPFMR